MKKKYLKLEPVYPAVIQSKSKEYLQTFIIKDIKIINLYLYKEIMSADKETLIDKLKGYTQIHPYIMKI